MARRRDFLKAGAAAGLTPAADASGSLPRAVLLEARERVRDGQLGQIRFCRVSHPSLLSAASFVLDGGIPAPVVEVEPAAPGMALLGSRATLAIDRSGCRTFG